MQQQPTRVAIVHDYLTQRGGAERVVLALARAFPGAPIYTSFYEPDDTFPEFAQLDVRVLPINHLAPLRRHHRLALPVLAPAFSRLRVEADVVVCSSTGWAHGAAVRGRHVVYCHSPARWLWMKHQYVPPGTGWTKRATLRALEGWLRRWDVRAARRADRYVVNSALIRERVARAYGIESEIVPPPFSIGAAAQRRRPAGLPPGVENDLFLCVSRLLPYKNVRPVIEAFASTPDRQLVIVGSGPEEAELRAAAPANVAFTGAVGDAELAWLYAHARGLVAASYEDFGIAPLEAAAFGVPVAALRWGGFLDTVRDGETGVHFDRPEADLIRGAIDRLVARPWDAEALITHAAAFSEPRFAQRMQSIVDEELALV
jgi:glycosyltransferase involved in cell wall biosynthesis